MTRRLLGAAIVTVTLAHGGVPASSTTYLCADPILGHVFTDSPSQLDNCQEMTKSRGGAPENAGQPAAVPSPPLPVEGNLVVITPPLGTEVEAGQITVPVMKVGRSLVVQARLNQTREAKLIVDTGADITVLSTQIARDLGLFGSGSSSTMTLNTAGGSVRADMMRLTSLSVETAEVHDVHVAIHDLPDAPAGVEGLLGLTFLDKFLVTLDAQKGQLILRRRE